MKNGILLVAFAREDSATSYDPAKIHFAYEYIFLENIFSPLIEYSPDGQLVSGIAERFEWIGNEAHFTIRPDLKTIDGHKITAEDVEQSFKRLFILDSNTHGGLKDMLCPGVKLTKLTDACPGMYVRDEITFVMKFKEKKIFLFPMLAAIDFAIIPWNSVDTKTLKIIDYRNISGPYYVERDNGKGNIELSANPHHYHFSKNIAQKIKLVPVIGDDMESLKLFSNNKVDHITTVADRLPPDTKIQYARQHGTQVNKHSTYPLLLYYLAFTKKGRTLLSSEERFAIGKIIKKAFWLKYADKPGYESSKQIFPVFGEGGLPDSQFSNIEKKFDGVEENISITKNLLSWDVGKIFIEDIDSMKYLKKYLPNTKVLRIRKIPGLTNYKQEKIEEPDFFIVMADVGFQEDIGLLSYYMNMDFFYLYGKEGKKWLESYMTIPEKTKRLELLRDLHYKTLYHGCVIPIAMSPYTAIVRKPWKFNFSKYHANNPLWRIYKK